MLFTWKLISGISTSCLGYAGKGQRHYLQGNPINESTPRSGVGEIPSFFTVKIHFEDASRHKTRFH